MEIYILYFTFYKNIAYHFGSRVKIISLIQIVVEYKINSAKIRRFIFCRFIFMKVRLTLSIDERIVERSKKYAAQKKISLSNLIEKLLEEKIDKSESKESALSFLQRTAGTAKFPIPDIDAAKDEFLSKKYGYEINSNHKL